MKQALIDPVSQPLETKKDVLGILDVADSIPKILDDALTLKRLLGKNGRLDIASGHTLGMIFEKNSTRTRVSFEVGFKKLGGEVVVMCKNETQLGRGESVHDTAKVLSRYLDAIMYRAHSSETMAELARHSSIPVISGLDDKEHPCQVLADLLTLKEHFGRLDGLKVAYVGDAANNVAHSLLLAAPLVGMDIRMVSPPDYRPEPGMWKTAEMLAAVNGTDIDQTGLSHEALSGVHVVVTDTWVSMGDETEQAARVAAFADYTITPEVMSWAEPSAVFLHCLPAHYGEEVVESVAHGPQSLVWDEAENRMWVQMALLCDVLGLTVPRA
ncbi:MAG: ornithine carbamoyltransferase [Euryarchaeota archaeon]|nr:ornithine carbamoyltransferase [Euryarchaeota archaeon]